MDVDDTDREILRALQADARKPFSEIAREIDMSSATVHDRVSRLEEAGVIRGYHADVDPKAVGLGTTAFVGLRVEQGREDETLDRLTGIEGVREVNLTTGEWDVILRLVAEDTDHLRALMFEEIADMDGFARSQTMVVLGTEYESPELPL
ncbi:MULTISPECIES: Lrp/AsnC family transcriptional regulator [Halobacterium]|uniref:Transcription regulator n=4 Tax=Halobacterium salinarum TaxID=2242 RepID=Q9HQ13_HALSA|nr:MULTISPECIES: Lrp/AsnC family transcriptional regulator [Halobacterium]AAG19704.1 transcription regulator [Halobacterium salinarum NRC-1]MBB6088706.1 Lrp/AsnC family transcriptional regulator for asnA, asnC and gidA [Halobacterium salinarum]MCF2165212.1 Lrp/AsnC family transcriptional regulator [Halobacterium salinarum]MCF2167979.1 Lrp/AsnC family transcriptional regulator [Halobacterium salinarum]MCF2238699.1 Lrp/AsnC family transcriptional regulator [Halobacterium salinarum]